MDKVISLLSSPTTLLWSAITSAGVSAVVSSAVAYCFKRGENRHKVKVEYEYEQRRKHHELIGRYKGRLLNAANSLMYRQWNIYRNNTRGWLKRDVGGSSDGYYFSSTVYRFLCLCGLVRQLETESIMLDPGIAKEADFSLLKYAAMLHWVMTDVSLFEGVAYNDAEQTDHFFSDEFRQYGERCLVDGKLLNFSQFKDGPYTDGDVERVLQFFDGLRRSEERLRWDRLVALHLVLMAFINTFGYDWQYSSADKFEQVAGQMKNREILGNLVGWLTRHHLSSDKEARKIIMAQNRKFARA
ncbi:hypothetical protein [Ralstonia solanacearum]|uniref:hypothetical protein n=1 Tax=Ralstonia solanacearum TaxID=305 RepID=UPI000F60921E|nr:hypothetical protein [Ralstonia solanacearum]